MRPSTQEVTAEHVHTYLELTHLLDEIQQQHPEVSAPLRLTLLGARRDGRLGSLDKQQFRDQARQHEIQDLRGVVGP